MPVAIDRRANRLAPVVARAGVAIVVDSWPLVRAGIRQLLVDADIHVTAEDVSVAAALPGIDDGLDLAVIGAGSDPLIDSVRQVKTLQGGQRVDGDGPRILVMVDRIGADELRELLAAGVEGVVQRSAGLDELGQACSKVLEGQRVLSGAALSVLAGSGLDLTEDTVSPSTADAARASNLTPKETEVLSHLARHRSNAEIAAAMHLAPATVKSHLSNLYAKLEVRGRREAVVAAVERGIVG
jgi:DNA-binding NarL/FixJ family response regulator